MQTYKNLDWLWSNKHLQKIKQFSQHDTIIIDDTFEKFRQHPHNVIVLPEYTQELHKAGNDTALSTITRYLTDLRNCSNVSAYIASKQIVFGDLNLATAMEQASEGAIGGDEREVDEQSLGKALSEIKVKSPDQKYPEASESVPPLTRNQKRSMRRALADAKAEASQLNVDGEFIEEHLN